MTDPLVPLVLYGNAEQPSRTEMLKELCCSCRLDVARMQREQATHSGYVLCRLSSTTRKMTESVLEWL
jgi:hypothetical protein